jgi:pimeloyl-ACP methyl ester carboxylesterase
MKSVIGWLVGSVRLFLRILGFGAIGSVALAGLAAFRHMLVTPQPLDSPLPGEAHLYRWKRGHVYYKVAGEQHTPPMVLLHTPELAGSAYEMLGIMASLATRYRVYAPDLLGFGLSDRPDISYTSDLYTELLHDFLVNVVREPATLVASRLSCNYAIAVAANSPELCTRLVLLSPTALHGHQAGAFGLPPVLFPTLPGVLPARIIIPRQAKMLLFPLLVAISRLSERLIENPPVIGTSNPPPDYTYATTHQFGAEYAPMDWLAGNLSSDVSADIPKLQQPTLLIWGTGELHYARQGREAQGSLELEEAEIGSVTTRIVLLQRTTSVIHKELPETVVKTILQWSAEPAIPPETGASTPGDHSEQEDTDGMPDAVVAAANDAIRPRIEAYCMKCKEKRGILNAREVTMKNGRIAVQGDCEVCGTSLFRMGRLAPGYPQTPI